MSNNKELTSIWGLENYCGHKIIPSPCGTTLHPLLSSALINPSLPSSSIMVSVQYFAAVSPLPKIPNNGKSPAGISAVTDSGTNSKTLQNGIF